MAKISYQVPHGKDTDGEIFQKMKDSEERQPGEMTASEL